MFADELREQISQGDIFDKIPVALVKFPEAIPIVKEIKAMLVTHDCEFDKDSCIYVMVTEIRPLREVNRNSQGNIRDFKTLNTFYIQACDVLEESYLDFRRTYQVQKDFLFDRKDKGFRIVSLGDETRLALQRQLSIFFGYKREVASVDLSAAIPPPINPAE